MRTIRRFPKSNQNHYEKKYFVRTAGPAGRPAPGGGCRPQGRNQKAAAALGSQTNYAWQATVEVPADSQFKPGPTDGKTEKGGYTTLSFSFGDNTTEAVLKGTNGAIKTDDGWKTLADAMKDDGGGGFNPTMFIARRVQNYKVPAVEAASLADAAKELKKDTNSISGDLTEAGAKDVVVIPAARRERRRGPTVTNPKVGEILDQGRQTGEISISCPGHGQFQRQRPRH